MARLNEQKLQLLLKEGKPRVVAIGDGTGLALRITPTGASWQLRYRHAGRPHWLTLAKYADCSLKEAQKKATKERARINEGALPGSGKAQLCARPEGCEDVSRVGGRLRRPRAAGSQT